MRILFTAGAPVIVSLYITLGNMAAFRPATMRSLSIVGLVLTAGALWAKLKKEGLSAIDKGFFVYMAINVLLFLGFPGRLAGIMADFPTGILYAVLFVMVVVPDLTAKRYFTEYFARKTTPEAIWDTDIFKTVNCHMSRVWAAIFALSAFVTTIPFLFDVEPGLLSGLFFQIILPALLMVGVGLPLNRKYPAYYQKKMGIEPVGLTEPAKADVPDVQVVRVYTPSKEIAMDNQLKVVAINGSPHENVGNTSLMLEMIGLELAAEGVVMEEIRLAQKHIEYCIGCAACLEKGRCWHPDDHASITDALLAADGIILASPVYFSHVTAQMKTFIDRSLAFGHKPRTSWKPGLAVSVSAGKGETATAQYLAGILHIYGAFPVGTLTALATNPGAFMGKELVEARAKDLARDLTRAIKEKRRYPATDENLSFYLFMRDLVVREKDFMHDDYRHWQEENLLSGFEAYMGQKYTVPGWDPEIRKEWLKDVIRESKKEGGVKPAPSPGPATHLPTVETCRELLELMPSGFRKDEAGDLSAVYQFHITGSEEFVVHLTIEGGVCAFHEGPHPRPDVVITSPADLWLAISRGEEDGQRALMAGKYHVQGKVGLLMRLNKLFGG